MAYIYVIDDSNACKTILLKHCVQNKSFCLYSVTSLTR